MKESSTLVHAGVSYDFGAWQVGVDILNAFDAEDDDIAYFFESRLAGELAGVEDIHFHPANPRTVRAMVRYTF
jgi:outer membrane receptor protein involved in Fe transport